VETIDIGDHGWRHPDLQGLLYGSESYCKQDAKNKGLDPEKVYEEDTRLTIAEVVGKLSPTEKLVWDEADPHAMVGIDPHDKWPEGRIRVFVETGSNEGLYLYVEVKPFNGIAEHNRPPKLVLIGKTLDCSTDKWYECWMSAARIAKQLGA
jgi:hypothetical protein